MSNLENFQYNSESTMYPLWRLKIKELYWRKFTYGLACVWFTYTQPLCMTIFLFLRLYTKQRSVHQTMYVLVTTCMCVYICISFVRKQANHTHTKNTIQFRTSLRSELKTRQNWPYCICSVCVVRYISFTTELYTCTYFCYVFFLRLTQRAQCMY